MNGSQLETLSTQSTLNGPENPTLKAENGSKKLSASEKRKLRAKAKKLADRAER